MYPYNRNTQLYSRTKTLSPDSQKKAEEAVPACDALSTDRRLEELLSLSMQETAELAGIYEALQQEQVFSDAKNILKTMELDEKKHLRRLRELVFEIYGTAADAPAVTAAAPCMNGGELMEWLLLREMDDSTFYRNLLLSMPEESLRDAFFEILTDKQNHTAALNHLYAKYFI